MDKKPFRVTFYRPHLGLKDDDGRKFRAQLQKVFKLNQELNDKSKSVGIKFIHHDKDYIFLELRKYRDDAPHIGSPNGSDRQIPLKADEHILEKSFILYSIKHRIFALQSSQSFRSPFCFSEVFNNQGWNENIMTSSVLGKSADAKLNKNISSIARFNIAITDPSSKKARPNDDWGNNVLAAAGGATGRFEVVVKGNMRGSEQHPLKPGYISQIAESIKDGWIDKAVATTSTGEDIDVLKDRLRAKIVVQMLGRYPTEGSVHDELIRVFEDQSHELVDYLN